METWFELWDSDNASLVGTYTFEIDAFKVVIDIAKVHGTRAASSLVLAQESETFAEIVVVDSGLQLINRAYGAVGGHFLPSRQDNPVTDATIVGTVLPTHPIVTGNIIGDSIVTSRQRAAWLAS